MEKIYKCQVLHFHLINCLQDCGTGGRRARAQRSAVARERVGTRGGEGEPGALSIDLFLLNLEQRNGRWNGKNGKSFVDFAAASFFLDMIHDISTRSGGTWARARVLESVRN